MVEGQTEQLSKDERARLVNAACETWIRRLVDHSRNNTLLFFRQLTVGTLDIAQDELVRTLLAGGRTALQQIAAAQTSEDADRDEAEKVRTEVRRKLVSIQRKALSNSEERGLDTLYLAAGFATWPASDGGRPYCAPALLLPAKIEQRGQGGALSLQLVGEPQANIVLHYVLEQNHHLTIDPEALIDASSSESDEGWKTNPEAAFQFLEREAESVEGFEIQRSYALGNFQFAKMAIVEDLRKHREELVAHPIVAAIANHAPSREALGSIGAEIEPASLDQTAASDEHLVLDADSSQQAAIATICTGRSGVIQGPPGTGKSQTIANLIGELVGRGKRILFVAEKRAALDAVLKRLQAVGLGHLALDLHGASISRKEVMGRIRETLQAIQDSTPPAIGDGIEQLEERRKRLNEHAERVNKKRSPLDKSFIELQGELLVSSSSAESTVRLKDADLAEIAPKISTFRELIREAASHGGLFLGTSESVWNEARVENGEDVRQILLQIREAVSSTIPSLRSASRALARDLGIEAPDEFQECGQIAELLQSVESISKRFGLGLFGEPTLRKGADEIRAAAASWWQTLLKFLFSSEFRSARRMFLEHRHESTTLSVLGEEATEACDIQSEWEALASKIEVPAILDSAESFVQVAVSALDERKAIESVISPTGDETASSFLETLERALREESFARALPRIYEIRAELDEVGLSGFVDDLRRNPCDDWVGRLDFIVYRTALDSALAHDPELAAFQGSYHGQQVEEFGNLDRRHLGVSADIVKRYHGETAIEAMNAHPEQRDLVRREATKRSRHISLRRLLAQAPHVLTRIAPCWVASPLSVSQLLDGGAKHFDVVVFDEASQVLPEDAVTAIMRGEQVVVAGDQHQLPPTTFFAGIADDDEDEDDQVSGFESLLDNLSSFLPNWLLEWHYRSQDERLIAFSNGQIYDSRLITFPGTLGDGVISHIEIPFDARLALQEESSSREVEKVVELVISHAEENVGLPEVEQKSLGVITMGVKHANRVQAAVDRALEARGDLWDYFSTEKAERFFVKNLETVQGDERDAIILSIGYGKTGEGDLPHRFGPLTQDVGYRRLNVAVTRAKSKMTVVSSFSHRDVDLNRSGSRGVRLLKAYLDYAENGGQGLKLSGGATGVPLNSFEADIKNALELQGVSVIPQYGASRYRIDLVAIDPDDSDRPILAIECDGASYHSSATARERDRLRQEHLMRLGWRFHRIWSTDWFNHREDEINRAVEAYNHALTRRDEFTEPSEAAPHLDTGSQQDNGRDPAPSLPRRGSIQEYTEFELTRLAQWAMSDSRLRTDEELIEDMFAQLPFARRGTRIRSRLQSAIDRAKRMAREAS